jgi:hypothetical protein
MKKIINYSNGQLLKFSKEIKDQDADAEATLFKINK